MKMSDNHYSGHDSRMRLCTVAAALLAVCALGMVLPTAPAAAAPVLLADADGPRDHDDRDRGGHSHRPRLLRYEYQGYESRLRVMDRRIDEDERYHRYSAEKAAEHRRDLAAIRARFHYRDERARRMNRLERDRFDADLSAQEGGLSIVYKP
ncbi:MAG TPA: hypothetical protein VK842_09005 [bacterium]|jgi:hypothetical protein|nr:hypothetical protein [bacterium]